MAADKFKGSRDRYGAIAGEQTWLREMLAAIRGTHGSYLSNRDGFVSMAVSVYDIEPTPQGHLVLYQARFSSGRSGARLDERMRKIKFHLAVLSPDSRVLRTKAIETPHGIIRRWIEEEKSPLSLLETREAGAKSF